MVTGDVPAAVSLPSLVWAHCLVRSRALSLQLSPAAGGEGATTASAASPLGQLDMCMLPGVDLCNHPTAGPANCAVHLRLSRARTRQVFPRSCWGLVLQLIVMQLSNVPPNVHCLALSLVLPQQCLMSS